MSKPRRLTEKQAAVAFLISDWRGDCFGWPRLKEACERVGYSDPYQEAYRLRRNEPWCGWVKEMMGQSVQRELGGPDVVKLNLLRLATRAEDEGNLALSKDCWIALGKSFGLFSDRLLLRPELPERNQKLDERAEKIAVAAALATYSTRRLPDGTEIPLPNAAALYGGTDGDALPQREALSGDDPDDDSLYDDDFDLEA